MATIEDQNYAEPPTKALPPHQPVHELWSSQTREPKLQNKANQEVGKEGEGGTGGRDKGQQELGDHIWVSQYVYCDCFIQYKNTFDGDNITAR